MKYGTREEFDHYYPELPERQASGPYRKLILK